MCRHLYKRARAKVFARGFQVIALMSIFELRVGECVTGEGKAVGDAGRLDNCWPLEEGRSFFSFKIDEIPTLLELGGDDDCDASIPCVGGGMLS